MYFADTTRVHVKRWLEYRTPSGRWSKKRENYTEDDNDAEWLRSFFNIKFPKERRYYTYFREGYLPYRVTVVDPTGDRRAVWEFDYYTVEKEN